MNRIMIDLETMSTRSNAAIIAIGAVRFDEYEVMDCFYRVVGLDSCLEAGLEVDGKTIVWWLDQSSRARRELLKHPSCSLITALADFYFWAGEIDTLWGNGAAFDNVVLANAYKAVGMKAPWEYHQDRCYRTLRQLVPHIEFEFKGIKHYAVDDAKNQAEHLLEIEAWLESSHAI